MKFGFGEMIDAAALIRSAQRQSGTSATDVFSECLLLARTLNAVI